MAPYLHQKLAMISSWTPFGLNLNEMKKWHFAWNLHVFNHGSHILNEFFPVFPKRKQKNITKHFFSLSAEEDEEQTGNCCSNTKVLYFTPFVLVWHPCINRNVIFFSALVPKISQSNMANSVDRIWRTLLLLWHQEWVTQYYFLFVSFMIQFTLYTTGSKLNSLRVVPYFRDAGVGWGRGGA